MARLEDLSKGAAVCGVLADQAVTVVDVQWAGSNAITLVYRTADGRVADELLYRDREPSLSIAAPGRAWSFDGDGALFRLAAEARRIRLAHLLDPLVAVHASDVEPLPHQISAVYEEMLTRQPLRFLLADDPGAGKTIMTGLFIRELALRGDLQRCLIVCPGSLVEQWQDELDLRFDLPFEILTSDKLEASRTGNWFAENPLAIARLDKLSRDVDAQALLKEVEWDLVVCDEAHKLAASFFGSEVRYTKRYHLGQLLSGLTRHFLLLTATPHNGKEADFQLFMALLDGDRFEGKYRPGVHGADAGDLMRRLVKEEMLTFAGTPLFPERIAYTVPYKLTDAEAALYRDVTAYVREEFNRADDLQQDGRKGTVGFALTVLQRRLASSPEAIYQSLRRRRERLEKRLREEQLLKRGAEAAIDLTAGLPALTGEDLDDLDEAPEGEAAAEEERIVDQASAARTITDLQVEIGILTRLEELARRVRASGQDRKWEQLSTILQDRAAAVSPDEPHRKLVVFTEHRDTLAYLCDRIRALIGRPEAVVAIHGGLGRDERRTMQERFTQDPTVEILVATDAAGEGINLQRAHLMVNYDLPWNPNRIEQRFGRIHRIGQTEVCHLWNLVAADTREGEVYHALLTKLEEEGKALGGRVFDVLGKLSFDERPLRDLLIDAIRYGDRPEVRRRLTMVVEGALDRDHLLRLLEERALAHDSMDLARVRKIGAEMARADARRLQPHFIASFFRHAFRHLGGQLSEREPNRFEVRHVPPSIRQRDRAIGRRAPLLPRYERIAFERGLTKVAGKPEAALIAPGHPLLDATVDLMLERHGDVLRRGTVLVDPADDGEELRALCTLEHAIQDGRPAATGERRIVSRRLQFVELRATGEIGSAGSAPYLDYRPVTDEERALLEPILAEAAWLGEDLEARAIDHAITTLVPEHLAEVRRRIEALNRRADQAVKARLWAEITYWDARAADLALQEQAGKAVKLPSIRVRQRVDDLQGRLDRRLAELAQERQLSARPPVATGGAVVVPIGLVARLVAPHVPVDQTALDRAKETRRIERLAMDAVAAAERALGHDPVDVGAERRGYDIESRTGAGHLRFIEVKGRIAGATTVTVTRNEILTALNRPDDFILAIVTVGLDGQPTAPRYVRTPFRREPDFGAESVNYDLSELLDRAGDPS